MWESREMRKNFSLEWLGAFCHVQGTQWTQLLGVSFPLWRVLLQHMPLIQMATEMDPIPHTCQTSQHVELRAGVVRQSGHRLSQPCFLLSASSCLWGLISKTVSNGVTWWERSQDLWEELGLRADPLQGTEVSSGNGEPEHRLYDLQSGEDRWCWMETGGKQEEAKSLCLFFHCSVFHKVQ